jgi:hypothetical protein
MPMGLGNQFSRMGAGGSRSPASFADGLVAPAGFHFEFVIDELDGSREIDELTGQPVVDLVAG